MTTFPMKPVGVVHGPAEDPSGDRGWGDVDSVVEVDERFGERPFEGLDGFSHVELVFVFDEVEERADYREPQRPLGRRDMPAIGIFADRGPVRPNRLGHSACEIVAVEGRRLTVRGLDAVDGTPVLDIKPAMPAFLPEHVEQPEWAQRLMESYFDG
ncbi:SAM-dependent methyltransferase [Mumia sp. zg.B53]|uniref:SAM-dependent methyltransferase n=1 Tax=Mumia sp. zg.B53 TaxID=2855449 RepID=UPI001C6F1C1F|nr:SAM-dependent methyltransferase [Mumia sp. zg.B53]MBW9215637.1 SAM-dependent methyltransferase [Mumia sp. zg.B53]